MSQKFDLQNVRLTGNVVSRQPFVPYTTNCKLNQQTSLVLIDEHIAVYCYFVAVTVNWIC